MRRILGIVFAVCCAAVAASAQTDVYLRTERAGRGKVPIVIEDIDAASNRERDTASLLTSVIRTDLDYSGLVEPLRRVEGEDNPDGGAIAGAIFEGAVESEGESFVLEARLLDFASREIIFSKRYRFGRDARRHVAHTVSDEVVYFLVGERGIATTRLLFRRGHAGAKDLYVIDYDGFGEHRLTKDELVTAPLWLDPSRLCYSSDRRGNWDCYRIDLRQGSKYLLTQWRGISLAGSYYAPRDEIAMTLSVDGNHEIYVLDSSGKVLRRLTRNRAIDISPSWSPNGAEIVFVSDRGGTPQIYIMDSYGANVRRLSRTGSYNQSPAWSPRGDIIAYCSREGGVYRLRLISPDGLVEETLFEDYSSYEDPVWAPDGRHIAATAREGGRTWIVVIDIDTKEKRRVVQGESPDWSPLPPEPRTELLGR
jgi:TolB protein